MHPLRILFAATFLAVELIPTTALAAEPTVLLEEVSADLLSNDFRACFLDKIAPLNAESSPCLDQEYRRLDAALTREYRAALVRQVDERHRQSLQREERIWWRTRFRHCKEEVGGLGGSTATVVNENCEIEALADRVAVLQHTPPGRAKAVSLKLMDYARARAMILAHGWKPFKGDECGGVASAKVCARYPELGYCQGTNRGFCSMKFFKPDRCLFLTTVESPPGQGYTVIFEAGVSRGSCPKEEVAPI